MRYFSNWRSDHHYRINASKTEFAFLPGLIPKLAAHKKLSFFSLAVYIEWSNWIELGTFCVSLFVNYLALLDQICSFINNDISVNKFWFGKANYALSFSFSLILLFVFSTACVLPLENAQLWNDVIYYFTNWCISCLYTLDIIRCFINTQVKSLSFMTLTKKITTKNFMVTYLKCDQKGALH